MAVAMLATGRRPGIGARCGCWCEATSTAKMATMSATGTVKSVAADSVGHRQGREVPHFRGRYRHQSDRQGVSHKADEKKAEHAPMMITDVVKTGEKVSVKYHEMDGKMHAASVRVM